MLYMQDAAIRLSELDLISSASTQLVILSACETNVGKNATGEGVYSLARGFSSLGIPSVAATMWQADEETIYAITASFNKSLSEGMQKDIALQQAKIEFLKNNGREKSLPYYWANLIIVGNTEPVVLSTNNTKLYIVIIFTICLFGAALVLVAKRRKSQVKL